MNLRELARARARALWLSGTARLKTPAEAEQFLATVAIALRYGPNGSLPLASLYRAAAGPDPSRAALSHAIALTNHLLKRACAIEVDVIGGRLTLVHRSLIPALYVLVRRGRLIGDLTGLSLHARAAFQLIRQKREVSAGDVRRHLGLAKTARVDPGYEVTAELRRVLLVDRGPFTMRKSGIPYLSQEGYPYHLFHEAHADLVRESRKYSVERAASEFIGTYVGAARWCSMRKLASMFQTFLTRAEIAAAVEGLSREGRIRTASQGGDTLIVANR